MFVKKINLVYWWDIDNFGDCLSPFIVKKILGDNVNIIPKRLENPYTSYYKWFKFLVNKALNRTADRMSEYLMPDQPNLIAVGSILACGNRKSYIWGSGFMNEYEKYKGGRIFALRGRKSNEKIVASGGPNCNVFGDPALLLPLYINGFAGSDKYSVGIVPHWKDADLFLSKYRDSYKIIDLRTTNIEYVVKEITSCKAILSSSLHGIIVAHAYGIPAIWIKAGYIDTDGFKFADYFSSVNIVAYEGFGNYDEIIRNESYQRKLIKQDFAMPKVNLENIRQALLKAFPYK